MKLMDGTRSSKRGLGIEVNPRLHTKCGGGWGVLTLSLYRFVGPGSVRNDLSAAHFLVDFLISPISSDYARSKAGDWRCCAATVSTLTSRNKYPSLRVEVPTRVHCTLECLLRERLLGDFNDYCLVAEGPCPSPSNFQKYLIFYTVTPETLPRFIIQQPAVFVTDSL
jgi:hypothetical protein